MHLPKSKTFSPVISLFSTPLAAVHREFLLRNAFVTVFDLSDIDQSKIFSAADVLRNNLLHPEVGSRYKGY